MPSYLITKTIGIILNQIKIVFQINFHIPQNQEFWTKVNQTKTMPNTECHSRT